MDYQLINIMFKLIIFYCSIKFTIQGKDNKIMINKQSIVPIMILPPKQVVITPPMYNNYIKKRRHTDIANKVN